MIHDADMNLSWCNDRTKDAYEYKSNSLYNLLELSVKIEKYKHEKQVLESLVNYIDNCFICKE